MIRSSIRHPSHVAGYRIENGWVCDVRFESVDQKRDDHDVAFDVALRRIVTVEAGAVVLPPANSDLQRDAENRANARPFEVINRQIELDTSLLRPVLALDYELMDDVALALPPTPDAILWASLKLLEANLAPVGITGLHRAVAREALDRLVRRTARAIDENAQRSIPV